MGGEEKPYRRLLRAGRGAVVLNIGLEIFYESLRSQGARVYRVKPAGPQRRAGALEKDLEDILGKIL